MQQIERYGVIALVFLLVTIVAVSFWGDSKSPGFWSRLTGRASKKEALASRTVDPVLPAAAAGERAVQDDLPLSPAADPASPLVPLDPAPSTPPPLAQYQEPIQPTWSAPPAAIPAVVPAERPADAAVYVVEKGDSLIGIASKMLGSKKRWTEIRDLNRGIDPRRLAVGMKLAIPASALVPASRSAAKSQAPSKLEAPARRSNTAPASKAAKNGGGTYVVRKGDTLKSIAERLLGSSSRWREIAASNPGVNPQRIHVGSKLRMPNGKSEPLVAAAAIPVHASSSRPRVR